MAKPWQDEMFDIDRLRREAERYRSEARRASSDDRRKHLLSMVGFTEALASNEKMRAWLERSIAELKAGEPLHTARP